MAGVILKGVSKTFPGSVTAVENLDLEVLDREFLVLLGPSGCGKSTTLRMLAGLESASSGEIRIGDRVVNHVPPKDRDIAMVFQNYALYPHMTVYKNMAFGLELRYGGGLLSRMLNRLIRPALAAKLAESRRGIRDRIQEASRTLGIEKLLDRMPRQLSGGERQRVALGRAIVRNPAAFLFDEPLSNLDAKLRVEMRRELKRLHQTLEATIIYVTHDQVEALTLGDRIVVMDRGKIQQVGPPMEIYDRPRNHFVAGFIGAPPMNFLTGKLENTENKTCFVSTGMTVELESKMAERLKPKLGQEVILGIRPEDVTVSTEQTTGGSSTGNRGRLQVRETLGDAIVVHVELTGESKQETNLTETLICKTEPRRNLQKGDAVFVETDIRRIHIFDPQSGRNLSLPENVT